VSKEVGEEERGALGREEWTGGATTPHPSMSLVRVTAVRV
jgi:hypothetical protein